MNKPIFQNETPLPENMVVRPRRAAAHIAIGYAAAGLLWILTSDSFMPYLTKDIETMVILNSAKGALFIFVTAVSLFILVYSQLLQIGKAQNQYVESVRELENAHEALIASEEELRQQFDELSLKTNLIDEKDQEMWSLFENMRDVFGAHEIILDAQGKAVDYRYLVVNPAYEKLLQRTNSELLGHCVTEIVPEIDPEFITACGDVALTGNSKKMNIFSKMFQKHLLVSLYSPRPGRFAILATDITEEKMHEKTVQRLAYYDKLTGLPNREKLAEVLNHELEGKTGKENAGALFYIDMDDLKLVNDSYGHSYGDAMIITAAMNLASLTEYGSTVARVGGDEFIVLIPGLSDPQELEELAQTFLETLSCEYEVKELWFHASASIGIVLYPQDGQTVEELLRNADAALYEAKRSGKRCWRFFRPAMQEAAFGNMLLLNGLRNALANHELEVYYQPQISLTDGRVVGFEALLRWRSPLHGNVSPAQFIPLAEKSHLIDSIGAWVIREACEFSRRLVRQGYPGIRVAVNVSPRQLIAPNFIRIIRDSFNEVELEATRLEIEITENVFIESMDDSVRTLNELQAMGVHLSLDDFGAGYSSLTYLRRLPVQTLKIDKSFIDSILTDQVHSNLIESIIDMAHILGLSVVAEGVETSAQLDRLAQCGCDTIQGYLVSRAVPEQTALEFLTDTAWAARIQKMQ